MSIVFEQNSHNNVKLLLLFSLINIRLNADEFHLYNIHKKNTVNIAGKKPNTNSGDIMTYALTYLLTFIVSGGAYCSIELMYRARTHYSMFFCSGMSVIILLFIYRQNPSVSPLLFGLYSTAVITAFEFIFGLIFNLWLDEKVWDYSNMPLNILGQVCLPFSVIWFIFGIIIYFVFKILKI